LLHEEEPVALENGIKNLEVVYSSSGRECEKVGFGEIVSS
jgi:hypothetical protein